MGLKAKEHNLVDYADNVQYTITGKVVQAGENHLEVLKTAIADALATSIGSLVDASRNRVYSERRMS